VADIAIRRRRVAVAVRRRCRVAVVEIRVATAATGGVELEALRLRLFLDLADQFVGLRLELGDGLVVADRVARGEGLVELALLEQRGAEVEEVLRLGHARHGLAELGARLREVLRVHRVLALVVELGRDVGLALGVCRGTRDA